MQIWVKDIFLFTDFVDFLLATRKKLSSKPGLKKKQHRDCIRSREK